MDKTNALILALVLAAWWFYVPAPGRGNSFSGPSEINLKQATAFKSH